MYNKFEQYCDNFINNVQRVSTKDICLPAEP